MSRGAQLAGLAAFLFICYAAAGIGSLFTTPETSPGGWYETLPKPAWTPPNWLFGPVWTVLYSLMGIAAWLVWRTRGGVRAAAAPLALFTIQLVLNVAWSIIFFGQQQPDIAAVEIVLLWLAILATTIVFWRVTRIAGILFIPYLLWVSYAAALNLAIARAV